ncbi:hypothetical protein DL98DRAFT_589217 [Cadophora sp. DSE1049]|nr:hypothetical protein DL98DRAFT_589217 [Cadophora sp. DSE1049]
MNSKVEIHHFQPTRFVPNNKLPVLVYRDVLPRPHNEGSAEELPDKNHWKKGGTWRAVPRHHFHPNTHECYAVFQGHSTLNVGRGPLDAVDDGGGLIHLSAGDAIVLPAGVSHCSVQSSDDYRYIGVYPEGSPRWKNEYCKDVARAEILQEEASNAPLPSNDPFKGIDGPLMKFWQENTGCA